MVASFVVLSLAARSSAEEALGFTGGTVFSGNPYSAGWSFTTDAPLSVASLGWSNVGTWTSSQVGIFDFNTKALLASTTVLAADPLSANGFRYHSLASPLSLAAGKYMIAGVGSQFYCENGNGFSAISVSTGAHIAYGSGWFLQGNALAYPTQVGDRGKGYFDPSFTTTPVPEPASLAALGLGATWALRRRKR